MPEDISDQEARQWKQQYYDQLDLLDHKEKDWQALESVLKKTVLRLSITAEGQHATIDRYLHDVRTVVKKQVDILRLENILNDISALVLKMGDKQVAVDKKVITMLIRLLEKIDFPDAASKQKNKLITKLSRSTDKNSDELADEVQSLLSAFIKRASINPVADSSHEQTKFGLLRNLFKPQNNLADNSSDVISNTENNITSNAASDKINDIKAGDTANYSSIINSITGFAEALPWPGSLEKEVNQVLATLSACDLYEVDKQLERLFSLIDKWQQQAVPTGSNRVVTSADSKDVGLLVSDMVVQPSAPDLAASSYHQYTEKSDPSAQEILIRLLEQLVVPPDRHEAVENIKLRIKTDKSATGKSATGWKRLLNDIAQLINTLRSGIQDEKQEFETFLQQITGRLKEMDGFLLQENALLNEAEQAGGAFDAAVGAQVQDIHDDIKASDDLNDLKSKVQKRLSVVSDHIKQYRINEQVRYTNAQQNVENMQSRLQQLEQETGDLRKLILVKNKEAMFDVLTKIPNRLSYEKKAVEEIGRCKRFAAPLSMAVWDIDLFKQVNDTYGHKVGDMVLKAVARLLKERMRETDFIARYGGEEFVMFLPGADESKALELADALREKISVCKFKHYGEMIKITVSCGVTSFIKGDNHESMFERADKALYAAKHNGRNKCVAASTL